MRSVSTDGQTLAVQKDLLAQAGIERLFAEKVSGIVTKRPELERLLDRLDEGDVLIVTKLDRLARSLRDLLNIVHRIGEAGATFKSLADTWADTTTPHGKLMLHVLGGLAEFERSLILQRTNEGRAKARAEGKPFGRRPNLTAHQRREALKRLEAGDTTREIALSFNVSHSTISRLTTKTEARH